MSSTVLLWLFHWHIAATALLLDGNAILIELGEKEYREIRAKSTLPIHGACWHDALKIINSSCEKLNDRQHSLLALRLADCFLEDSGHVTYRCYDNESEISRRRCISGMSDRAFGVYSEFYAHATHLCFFLNQELWRVQTERSIERLYEASSRMREQLMEASEMQSIVLESQKEGLRMQNELLTHGQQLGSVIRSSAETVSGMVVDFKESAKDQRQLLYEIFSYLRTFQNWIFAEVSWFQSISYYTIACIVCALFSSSKRTAEARIGLFTILSLNVVVERMLVQCGSNAEIDNDSSDDKARLIQLSWTLRKAALAMCFITLAYAYYSYNDSNYENYKILRRIENRLDRIGDGDEPRQSHSVMATSRYFKRVALQSSNGTPKQQNGS